MMALFSETMAETSKIKGSVRMKMSTVAMALQGVGQQCLLSKKYEKSLHKHKVTKSKKTRMTKFEAN